jgi:hypothetical protein
MPDKKPYLAERIQGKRFVDVFDADEVQYVFADGTAYILLGPETIKMEFTRALRTRTEDNAPIDERETFLRLAMPTSAAVEFCIIVLEQYATNSKLIQEAASNSSNGIREALKRVAAIKI